MSPALSGFLKRAAQLGYPQDQALEILAKYAQMGDGEGAKQQEGGGHGGGLGEVVQGQTPAGIDAVEKFQHNFKPPQATNMPGSVGLGKQIGGMAQSAMRAAPGALAKGGLSAGTALMGEHLVGAALPQKSQEGNSYAGDVMNNWSDTIKSMGGGALGGATIGGAPGAAGGAALSGIGNIVGMGVKGIGDAWDAGKSMLTGGLQNGMNSNPLPKPNQPSPNPGPGISINPAFATLQPNAQAPRG